MTGKITVTKQIRPIITILSSSELPSRLNVTIANGSSFPSNIKFFLPPEVSIAPNGTIMWTNDDTVIHTVTSGKPRQGPSVGFDSGLVRPGGTFNHTFSKTGIFDYYSTLNPYMIGKVVVGFYLYNLQSDKQVYPLNYLITGNGNQIQKINLQSGSPMLEIRMLSPSPGNLTLVIPRTVLDKLDQEGKDDAFGVIGNRPVEFNETADTSLSRNLVIQFDKGVNYIQILGTKTEITGSPIQSDVHTTKPKDANKTSGIGLSIDNGTLGYKTVYEHTTDPKTFTPEEQAAIDTRCNVFRNNYSSLSVADRGWFLANC